MNLFKLIKLMLNPKINRNLKRTIWAQRDKFNIAKKLKNEPIVKYEVDKELAKYLFDLNEE